MKPNPLVSVIVPCFNHGRYLGEALESILAQSYEHWECLVVDDGSTDETSAVADVYCRKDARISHLKLRNGGVSAARNAGLDIAKGSLIQFLDADDLILPGKLEVMVSAMESHRSLVVAFCNWCWSQKDGPPRMKPSRFGDPTLRMERPILDLASRWETDLSIPVHCFLLDARIFGEHRIRFDDALPTHEDWDCWLRVFALGPAVVKVPDMLAVYRMDEQGMSQNIPRMVEGFGKACAKQRRLWSSDVELTRQLAIKQRSMRRHYRQLRAGQAWDLLPPSVLDYLAKRTPWPIQRLLHRLARP